MSARPSVFLLLICGFASVASAGPLWLKADTDRFRFIYTDDQQWAVDELMLFADEVHNSVTALFGTTIGRVPVVLYGQSDLANGYYTPAPPQHIGLYTVAPSIPWMGARTDNWLRLLLTHELTHFVQANFQPGVFGALGRVFGASIGALDIGFAPLWFTEGLAIYAETEFTSGGRLTDPFFEMEYKAPIIAGSMFSFAQAGYDSHLAPRGRYYTAGGFLIEALIERHGEPIVGAVMADFARFPFFGIWGPIRRQTGAPMRTQYRRIIADLSERYREDRGIEPSRLLTPAERSDYHLPSITDRGWYVYRTRPDAVPAIVHFSHDSGTESTVIAAPLSDHASLSATRDGALIAFASPGIDRTLPSAAPASDIYLLDVDTATVRALTTRGGYYQPVLSPDGSFLIAVGRSHDAHRIVRWDLAGSDFDSDTDPAVLYERPSVRTYTPSIDPTGTRIAFAHNDRGDQRIAILDLLDGEITLLPSLADDGTPYAPWFADVDTILYAHDAGGALSVYEHRLSRNEVRLIATDRVGAVGARRDGHRLIVGVYTEHGYALADAPVGPGVRVATDDAADAVDDDEPVAAADRPAARSPDDRAQPTNESAAPTRYDHAPLPAYWLPAVALSGGVADLDYLGFGALSGGADYTGRHEWIARLVYFPALSQIGHDVRWTTRTGPWASSVATTSAYYPRVAPTGVVYYQDLVTSAALDFRIVADTRLGVTRHGAVGTGISLLFGRASLAPFSIAEIGTDAVVRLAPIAIVGVGALAERSSVAPRAAQASRSIGGSVGVTLPFIGPSPESVIVRSTTRATVGLARNHSIAAEQAALFSTNAAYARTPDLRGFAGQTEHERSHGYPGRFRVAIDYLTPFALFDAPVLSGVGFTRLGAGVFAEATGGFTTDGSAPTVAIDDAIGIGIEMTTVLTIRYDFPFTAGVAVRVRTDDPASFGARDIGFYVRTQLLQSITPVREYLALER